MGRVRRFQSHFGVALGEPLSLSLPQLFPEGSSSNFAALSAVSLSSSLAQARNEGGRDRGSFSLALIQCWLAQWLLAMCPLEEKLFPQLPHRISQQTFLGASR